MTTIGYAADLRRASARYDAFEHALEAHFDVAINDRGAGFGQRLVKL
jgi:hypothetical protein